MSGRHRLERTRRRPPLVRAGVLVVGGCLLLSVRGTFAYWNDTATVQSGSLGSGTLDLEVAGNEGNPTAWTDTSFAVANLVPGESYADSFPVQNTGSVSFSYTATATASGALAPYLTFTAYVGGTATNGTSGGLRAGSCGGSSMGSLTLTGTGQTVIGTPQTVAASASQNVCLLASLATTAPSAVQGTSASASYVFTAQQVGTP